MSEILECLSYERNLDLQNISSSVVAKALLLAVRKSHNRLIEQIVAFGIDLNSPQVLVPVDSLSTRDALCVWERLVLFIR